ncbi:MAG: GerMN domain-containing protein [Deltaproteobacteria bacterium]|nr:GerMN domain-containing protein [Deltaproteobacteria bacterium]
MARKPLNKKKKQIKTGFRQSTRQPRLLPACFFLLLVCGLLTALFFADRLKLPGRSPGDEQRTPSLKNSNPGAPAGRSTIPKIDIDPAITAKESLTIYRLAPDLGRPQPLNASLPKLTQAEKINAILARLTGRRYPGIAPLPESTRILKSSLAPPVMVLDLDPEILTAVAAYGAQDERLAIFCLTHSFLDNFPEYDQLQILIGGKIEKTLAGHIDISRPLRRQNGPVTPSRD